MPDTQVGNEDSHPPGSSLAPSAARRVLAAASPTAETPAHAASAATAPPPYPRRWRMLPVVLAAMFMAQFDLYVVNVAAPSLEHDVHAGPAALQLIVAGYGFTYASGLITGGRLGDLFSHRRMFLAGVLAFGAASVLCGI